MMWNTGLASLFSSACIKLFQKHLIVRYIPDDGQHRVCLKPHGRLWCRAEEWGDSCPPFLQGKGVRVLCLSGLTCMENSSIFVGGDLWPVVRPYLASEWCDSFSDKINSGSHLNGIVNIVLVLSFTFVIAPMLGSPNSVWPSFSLRLLGIVATRDFILVAGKIHLFFFFNLPHIQEDLTRFIHKAIDFPSKATDNFLAIKSYMPLTKRLKKLESLSALLTGNQERYWRKKTLFAN